MIKKVTQTELDDRKSKEYRDSMDAMTISRFQAKVVLDETSYDSNSSLLDKVQEYMSNSATRREKIAWEEASFRRGSKMINSVGSELNLSTKELDDLFLKAKEITD